MKFRGKVNQLFRGKVNQLYRGKVSHRENV